MNLFILHQFVTCITIFNFQTLQSIETSQAGRQLFEIVKDLRFAKLLNISSGSEVALLLHKFPISWQKKGSE
ncbi:hypothetical protein MTR67_036581 [Solanum verrucosum]|uniref:Uncharacterized protein n=1 Tax=Solanum verrucosum TaxID=315347 RepID=A0AAF0UCT8_SOLVR|nr:hypothetical protein MTR67_036581 [Solanum verrucosum]